MARVKSYLSTEEKIGRASLLMMASIILSRLIGFVREWVIALTMGASQVTDVYYAAFTIPDFLNYLMASGALSVSFIPLLSSSISKNNEVHAKQVFRSISTLMGSLLIGIIIVTMCFTDDLASLIAPGFTGEEKVLLVRLIRIILPGQFFFFWGGLALSVHYVFGKFWIPALAPIIYNSSIILFGVLFYQKIGMMGFSVGVLVGALLSHGILPLWGLHRLGFSPKPLMKWSKEVRNDIKKYFYLSLPIMLGFSIIVTDEWITRYFASFLEGGAISVLSFARTEMRIPIAVIGQAAGMASFPFLARLWSNGSYQEFGETLLREFQKLLVLAPLASILLFVHADSLTFFIYGAGRLTSENLIAVTDSLKIYSLGVFFWILQVVISRGFYACEKTWFPSIVGTLLSFLALPLYGLLSEKLGFRGLALAGTLGVTLYVLVLGTFLRIHLKKFCHMIDWKGFYLFGGLWFLFLFPLGGLCFLIKKINLFQYTMLSAFLDFSTSGILVIGCSFLLLRTVMKRLTKKAVF